VLGAFPTILGRFEVMKSTMLIVYVCGDEVGSSLGVFMQIMLPV